MTNDITAIARACYDAYVTKDRAALEAILAPDFHFTSPLDNRLDRVAYLEYCWPNSERLQRFELTDMVVSGDRVFVTYVGHGAGGHRFRNTEILTVRDGKLVEAEVFFGWSIPHPAPAGAHRDDAAASTT